MPTCTPGDGTILETTNPNNSVCKCIKKWENNADGTSTVTFTDGTSTTFTTRGAQGLTGPKGDTGAPGSGFSVIFNDEADSTNQTIDTMEILKEFTTDKTDSNRNLVNKGDMYTLYILYEMVDMDNPGRAQLSVLFGAQQLGGNIILDNGLVRGVYEIKFSLTDNATGAMKVRVISRVYCYNEFGSGVKLDFIFEQDVQDLNSLDFNSNNYTFYAKAQAKDAGVIRCRAMIIEANKI